METKHAHYRTYEDFDPVFHWRREEDHDTVELLLPGFRREQIRVQIDHLRILVISGERRPLEGTWKRFKKEFELPKYCNEDAIHGNFSDNILSVVMPKRVTLIPQEEEQMPKFEEDVEEEELEVKKNRNVDFGGRRWEENITKKEHFPKDDNDSYTRDNYKFVENDDVETTREVALKFMVVIIVIMVIVSYLMDMSKSVLAQAQSYFQD